jgi:CelD/BcsL family acetyltransferase involved in cellulose biosynthesis
MDSNAEISITCHENEVPDFIEAELERLYGNIFSSMRQFRIYGWTGGNTGTYVVRRGEAIVTLLLFERDGRTLRVKNEGIKLPAAEIERFTEYMFARYPQIEVIAFKAIETDIRRCDRPLQRFNHLEDLILPLPATVEAYQASLKQNVRRNIKRYTERLARQYPGHEYRVYEKDELDAQLVRDIIEFNRARMAGKNIASLIDDEEAARIIELVRQAGLVGVIRIDGRLCAGAVSFQSGGNYFLNVLAHDPQYDEFGLGLLCCYQTICACIRRGGGEFHFLWGRYNYKFMLGATQRDLDNILLYRSRPHMLRNAGTAWHALREGCRRQVQIWFKYGEGRLSQQARKLVDRLRSMRRDEGESLTAARAR